MQAIKNKLGHSTGETEGSLIDFDNIHVENQPCMFVCSANLSNLFVFDAVRIIELRICSSRLPEQMRLQCKIQAVLIRTGSSNLKLIISRAAIIHINVKFLMLHANDVSKYTARRFFLITNLSFSRLLIKLLRGRIRLHSMCAGERA